MRILSSGVKEHDANRHHDLFVDLARFNAHVWAYLDPGAGSMMLQILLASMLSSAFFMKTWIRQVREGLLIRNKKA